MCHHLLGFLQVVPEQNFWCFGGSVLVKGWRVETGCSHSWLASGGEQLGEGPGCRSMAAIVLGALRCPVELVLALRSSHMCTRNTDHEICFRADLGEQALVNPVLFKPRLTVGGQFGPLSEVKSQGLSQGVCHPRSVSQTTPCPHTHCARPSHLLSVKRAVS